MTDLPNVSDAEGPGPEVECLFVSAAFQRFQADAQGKSLMSFTIEPPGRAKAAAALTLAGKDGGWASPVTGAFGGVAFTGRPPTAATVFRLLEAANAWLRGNGVREARIRLPPDGFADPTAAALENALHRLGWRLSSVDLNFDLPVMEGRSFRAALGETKRQELARLDQSGATARTLGPEDHHRAYTVIANNHAARGFPMNMTWPQVQALINGFPDRVSVHAVERAGEMLAAAIVLKVTAAYRYIFNWGEEPVFRREAPIALLAEGIMHACHEQGAKVLDLGIATENSEPNGGLIAFKEILKGRATAKRSYVFEV